MDYVLSLDQGTTSSRAILFDRTGRVIAQSQKEFQQYYPAPGWVEHDATEIWNSQLEVARNVLSRNGVASTQIAAIGITNQRETTVLWDRRTGEPLHHAIVWQDRRTAKDCDILRKQGFTDLVSERTGLVIDAYFSATKLRWLLDHVPDGDERAARGELAFGTIDTWLLWKLSDGRLHVTDTTNASRTMLMNLSTGDWDDELLALLRIPREVLPRICKTSELYGKTAEAHFGTAIPLGGAAGDQQAALFGQNCTGHGMAKNTYGTGCFMLMNIGDVPHRSKQNLITSVAWDLPQQRTYALEGSVFIAGAAVQWLRDGLHLIRNSAEVESLARSVTDSDGVYLVPAFAGLGAPHWDAYARGTIVGITRGTTAAHLARAALEGIAFQVADVLHAMEKDAGMPIQELRVDGGACVNDLLMQFQADILQAPVVRPTVIETTALGAAFFAGLAVGFWKDLNELQALWKAERIFEPMMSSDEAHYRCTRWTDALRRSREWEKPGL